MTEKHAKNIVRCPVITIQVWRDVNLWDTTDRVLRQDYNIHALIFTLLHQFSSD